MRESHPAGRRRSGPRPQRGFNLVEMLVVLVVLGVILGVAFPSFQYVANSGRLSNPANELLASLQLARVEAVRRGQRTVVCRSDNPNAAAPACSAANGNWPGWLAFVDTNANGNADAGERVLKVGEVRAPAVLTASPAISGANQRIVFRPDGMARTNAGALLAARVAVCVPTTLPADNARDVTITAGSRFAVAARNGAGACAAPAN